MTKGFTTTGGIRFEPPKNGDAGDYNAEIDGIKFRIVKSTSGFGISAYKDGKSIVGFGGGVSWRGTRKRCAEHADFLLRGHGKGRLDRETTAELAAADIIRAIQRARDEGHGAGCAGEPLRVNPYKTNTQQWVAWRSGWNLAVNVQRLIG